MSFTRHPTQAPNDTVAMFICSSNGDLQPFDTKFGTNPYAAGG